MNATSQLATGIEALERLLFSVEHLSLVINLNPAHGEMKHRLHQGNMESIIDVHGHVVEVLLGMLWIRRVFHLTFCNSVVILERPVEGRFAAPDFLCELSPGHLLHQTSA